jgi:dUTPase
MAVLSDKTIKERIAKNELIPVGDPRCATHCSYEFTAAQMLRGGSPRSLPISKRGTLIEPAQLVWIRAREEISLPANMVGLWIQTQKLSREGLLLLNISLIEPGYKGPLSAVLVNFGKKPVPIYPHTKIAKVIFLRLDGDATKLVEGCDLEKYKADLADMAANAPKSFLQLESFLPNIEERAKAKLEAIDKEINRNVETIVSERKLALEKDLRTDMRGFFLRWGIGLYAGLLIGCGLVWLMMSNFLPRLSEYSKVDELARKAAIVQQAETITGLDMQLRTLITEIESLKKQLKRDATDMTPLPDTDNIVPNQ